MTFFEIMLNLCIGIAGGVFSSIIVSRIFLIHSLHSEQLARVQEHFECTYRLNGTLLFYLYVFGKESHLYDDATIARFNQALLGDIKSFAKQESEKFNYMIFDDLDEDLYKIAVSLNDIIERLQTLDTVNSDIVAKLHGEIYDIQERFKNYKTSNNKYFKRKIFTDTVLRILFAIIIVIMALTIIA